MIILIQCFIQMVFLCTINHLFIIFFGLMIILSYLLHVHCSHVIITERRISLSMKGPPILNHFSETVRGIKSILTYGLGEMMKDKMKKIVQNDMRASISFNKTLNSYCIFTRHSVLLLQVAIVYFLTKQFHLINSGMLLYSLSLIDTFVIYFYAASNVSLQICSGLTNY